MAVDWSDPCAALAALRPAYYEVLSGKGVASVQFMDRTVTYSRADLKSLLSEIRRLEGLCPSTPGGQRRRFAITAGTRDPS